MNINEGKIVFNYLKDKNKSEREAYIEYDNMTLEKRNFILKNIIISYLVNNYYDHSLLFDHVNWSPEKRKLRIIDYVTHKYDNMHKDDREIIVEKILNN